MNVVELIEIALANVDDTRFEVVDLETAEFTTEAVSGLAELVFELASNAIAFSPSGEKVRVGGLFVEDSYMFSISERGAGMSEGLIHALNRMLEDPEVAERNLELALGLRLVARMAIRNGFAVSLVPGLPGTTAQVMVPPNLVGRIERIDELNSFVGFIPGEFEPLAGMDVFYDSSESAKETEAFLEMVFAPLRRGWDGASDGGNGGVEETQVVTPWPFELESTGAARALRIRVPGESYLEVEDDSPSTAAGEGAVDIRSALSTFDEGRRSAEESPDRAVS